MEHGTLGSMEGEVGAERPRIAHQPTQGRWKNPTEKNVQGIAAAATGGEHQRRSGAGGRDPNVLKTAELFATLFPQSPAVKNAVLADMRSNGYNEAFPIVVARWEEQNEDVVVDGHTRLDCARQLGLQVRVHRELFQTEEEAAEYAVRCQINRRNLTDWGILRALPLVDKLKNRGGYRNPDTGLFEEAPKASGEANGKSAERTAKILAISKSKVERARYVLKHASKELLVEIETEQLTINGAYAELRRAHSDDSPPCNNDVDERAKPETDTTAGKQETSALCPTKEHSHPSSQEHDAHHETVSDDDGAVDWAEQDADKEPQSREGTSRPAFNKQSSSSIGWAPYSWNPGSGCQHDCPYCISREWAKRFKKGDFRSWKFDEKQLLAPQNTPVPDDWGIEHRGVFVVINGDLWGKWVPAWQIQKVLDVCRANPQWTYLFLTKNPKRYAEFDIPPNCWIGATVDTQARAEEALEALRNVKADGKFISCEPLLERVEFSSLRGIGWLIVGARRKTMFCKEFQPPWEWVQLLIDQAKQSGTKVYLKENLKARRQEEREFPEPSKHD